MTNWIEHEAAFLAEEPDKAVIAASLRATAERAYQRGLREALLAQDGAEDGGAAIRALMMGSKAYD